VDAVENFPTKLPRCHREVREARRGDPDGLFRFPPSRDPRNDGLDFFGSH
jgi:hypothetical protein